MGNRSTACVTCDFGGRTNSYYFTGVTAVEHNLALNLNHEASQGTDIINGARNLPDQVTLSVVETDTAHAPGWSARMLEAMAALKRNRILCRVSTGMGTYEDMLLTEITATQDEENQDGWAGDLTFMQYLPVTAENAEDVKVNSNSSVRKNTGMVGTVKKVTGTAFAQILKRAGIG